jgi:hypothetical protein
VSELELRLSALRDELAWPETPRLEATFDRRPARAPRMRPLALALAVLLAVLAGVLALSPGARSAFLEIFRLQGATVERVERLPEVEVRAIDFGEQVSQEEAERRVGFELLGLGEPDAVYVRDGGIATFLYGDLQEPRLLLTQARGRIFEGFIQKSAGSGTEVERVTVDGSPGLFVSGDDHFVMFVNPDGEIDDERSFLAGTTLLWNRGDVLFRLEADVTRAEALELAGTLRP